MTGLGKVPVRFGALSTLIAVAAVFAPDAAFAGCAPKPLSALAGAGAVDAVQADAVPEAGVPCFSRAGLALLPEETCAALPGLETKKRQAEGPDQGSKHGAAGYRPSGWLPVGGEG